jgi:DNA-binding transcriptional LysR family regulator
MLDLGRLDLLARFARLGSIAAVAHEAGFTPSAVSQQLATLERETGAPLLERGPRSARLTAAGTVLAERAAGLLAHALEVESDVRAAAGEIGGPVVVGAVPTLAGRAARALAEVSSRFPEIRVALYQAESGPALDKVAEGQLDLAIIDIWPNGEPGIRSGVTVLPLRNESLFLAGPDSAGRGSLSSRLPDLVAGHPWLCPPHGHPSREYGDALLDSVGAKPRARWEVEGLATMAELVEAGLGHAILPAGVLPDGAHVSRKRVDATRTICLVMRDVRARAPAVREVAAELRSELRIRRK